MRSKDLIEHIDRVLVHDEGRFDLLAAKAELNPEYDFVGMDLRSADFEGANLRHFNFALADLRGSNIDRARHKASNLNLAITNETEKLIGKQMTRLRKLTSEYVNGRTATQRLIKFIEFASGAKNFEIIEFAALGLLEAASTRLEVRILELALSEARAERRKKGPIGDLEIAKFIQRLCKAFVAGGYPYRRAEIARELSALVLESPGVAAYLQDYSDRSASYSEAMNEVRDRLGRAQSSQS